MKQMPSVNISSFDVPQHVIPERHCTPAHMTSLMDVLESSDKNMAHVIMNQIVDMVCGSCHDALMMLPFEQL